jgi:DNA (cytosine-5)-methyltransferase 1
MTEFSSLRLAAALSVPDAAHLVGVAVSTAYRWEHGEATASPEALERLRTAGTVAEHPRPAAFTFCDLFAGIGGLRRGFDGIGGKCVFTSEWDRFAKATYLANFREDGPDHRFEGDITKVDADDIPPHDVLLAGFPCQPFSIAGVSKKNSLGRLHGFRDAAQGTLFFDVARIIDLHKPKVILLENVKNLLGHDGGRTFAVIRATLEEELGYTINVRVIDARCLVPQHRERIFIAGVRRDLGFGIDLETLALPGADAGPRLGSILHPEDGTEAADPDFTGPDGKVHARYVLSDKLWQYLKDYADKHRAKGNGFGFGLVGQDDVTRTLSARYHKDGSEILVYRGEGKNPRRLTPRECARLMGFEKPGEVSFRMPVSDTQAYRQFGNSVVVPVVERVAAHMAPAIYRAVGAEWQEITAVAAE